MKEVDLAMALIEQGDVYHLQLRNGAAQKGALGKIGCFGGAVDAGETAQAAACREVREETNLTPRETDLTYLDEVEAVAERDGIPLKVYTTVFGLNLPADQPIEAREGELVSIQKTQITARLDDLTPATRALFEKMKGQEK